MHLVDSKHRQAKRETAYTGSHNDAGNCSTRQTFASVAGNVKSYCHTARHALPELVQSLRMHVDTSRADASKAK